MLNSSIFFGKGVLSLPGNYDSSEANFFDVKLGGGAVP